MSYQVTVSTGNLYGVSVDTRRIPVTRLKQIKDVDTTGIQNNYVMMYDASTQTYKFVHPSEILDRADDINDDSLDYGSY